MTIQKLKQGLEIFNKLNVVKEKLRQIKDYFQDHQTLSINVAGVDVEIPKAQISQKVQGRIQELQNELNKLEEEFNKL